MRMTRGASEVLDWRYVIPDERHARWVLGYYGIPGGWDPGSCTWGIIRALIAADPRHRAAISLGFPALTAAVAVATEDRQHVLAAAFPDVGDGVRLLLDFIDGKPFPADDYAPLWTQATADDL